MRYLNKIIFINSADKSIRYAEINLDGNVHFIGTQGVGKSTLLRAILFFYNADKTKLGIPREKKTFDEYYLPYQNSYLIYEVKAEHGSFCVMAFKSQGRTAFRFFDAQYNQRFFIDSDGKSFETWDKTREALGRNISYTKIIHSYEEYRNILYGNNKGLSPEFSKYAILGSKQYQNIPRTITNVFLNANLSAEFVKQTIIKSLNEEEVTIDLATYSQNHLRDFESNLNDIKKWTHKNRNGENAVEKQAEKVSSFYSAIRHLEKRKLELAGNLGAALQNVEDQLPHETAALQAEELTREKVTIKLKEMDHLFEKKKAKIQEQIGKYKSKLDETKKASEKYAALRIDAVLSRVAKKNVLEFEKQNLSEEKIILSNHFLEIQQRYNALLKQLENQQHEFENSRQAEKNQANENFLQWREILGSQYELLYEEVRNQHRQELEVASGIVKDKEYALKNQELRRSEVKNKRFYETEIENCRNHISDCESAIIKSEIDSQQAKEKIRTLQKEWQLEETAVNEQITRKAEKQNDLLSNLNQIMVSVENKIKHNKNSLYAWLNEQVPGWENTIGKVIDEEHVLFQQDLNPRKITGTDLNFYGISIDTDEIDKKVKTVADYEQEKQEVDNQVQSARKALSELDADKIETLEKLKRKFQPKIKEQKDIIQNNEYEAGQSKLKLDEAGVHLTELKDKSEKEKNEILKNIEAQIDNLSEELIAANEKLQKTAASINRQIETKKKEKENKLQKEQQKLQESLAMIDLEINKERKANNDRLESIKLQQKSELDQKGADTKRLTTIELTLSSIESELAFIENNRDIVAEYNKDKRELFDREQDFKNNKSLLDSEMVTEQSKHDQQKKKFFSVIREHDEKIASIKNTVTIFHSDLKAFEEFKKSEIFEPIEEAVSHFPIGAKTENNVTEIIDELKGNHYQAKDRFTDLQETVNKFTGNFQENNIFSFKTNFISRAEYIEFAELLNEFIEEDKISEYKRRVEERFAHIIRQIGRETGELISKEGEIHGVISEINKDFIARNFVGAVKSMALRTVTSANRIFQLLVEIKKFNDENIYSVGKPNLFSSGDHASKNEKAISLLKQLIKEMAAYKEKEITLSDSFELEFRIVENDNDTDWVEKLTNVGSEGTDVLVKAMINILLLNVFKERAAKKNKDDFRLHCMMDEIGKLHPNNVKGILKFANDRNILLINSSPTSYNATDYRYTYILAKDGKGATSVKRIVSKLAKLKTEPIEAP